MPCDNHDWVFAELVDRFGMVADVSPARDPVLHARVGVDGLVLELRVHAVHDLVLWLGLDLDLDHARPYLSHVHLEAVDVVAPACPVKKQA